MAALTVATVVQRLEGGLPAGWTLAPLLAAPYADNTRARLHKTASVFAVSSVSPQTPPRGRRQRTGETTARVDTIVRVRWSWQLRADAMSSDIRAAYDGEEALLKALLAVSATDLHLIFESADRDVGGGDLDQAFHLIGSLTLRAVHAYALE